MGRLLQLNFDLVVIVGAAEGFYPVGFALKTNSEIEIVSFDAVPSTWKLLEELAELNGVRGRIRINGLCDIGSLRACLAESSRPFIFMDIEGGEAILLTRSSYQNYGGPMFSSRYMKGRSFHALPHSRNFSRRHRSAVASSHPAHRKTAQSALARRK